MIIEIHQNLYRYDLVKPPDNWDDEFLSFEYQTEKFGHKNKANLYFFTDSIEIANSLGENACRKYSMHEYFISSTKPNKALKLIDFNNRHNIYQMLCLLEDLKINVMTDDFKTYENENTFSEFSPIYDNIESERNLIKKKELVESLSVHSASHHEDIGLFGQRLTDFENGIKFKELVKEIYPEVDGYRWKEFDDNRGFSYCLFDPMKLTAKTTKLELI